MVLYAPLDDIPFLVPFHRKRLASLAGPRMVDLLLHQPSGVHQRACLRHLAEGQPGMLIQIVLTPQTLTPSARRGAPLRVVARDQQGQRMDLVFYHAAQHRARRDLPLGQPRLISGRWDQYQGIDQIVHPERIRAVPPRLHYGIDHEPVYPLTAGLTQSVVQSAIHHALRSLPASIPEWLDGSQPPAWPSWCEAMHILHKPKATTDATMHAAARTRLAFDELYVHQLGLQLAGLQRLHQPGAALTPRPDWQAITEAALPFTLTQGQHDVLADIRRAMQSPSKTVHLLQGDVGCGKTIVAWMLMVDAMASGYQCALLVPTEILADQHAERLRPLAEALGLTLAVLKSKLPAATRRRLRQELTDGQLRCIIGTHALLEDDVQFQNLGLVVIDEQHRFGVEQRMRLVQKSAAANVLLMTATPIPRTLLLASYGDLATSLLLDRPAGRPPITTSVVSNARMQGILDGIPRVIARNERIYWICPLIEDADDASLAAAELRYQELMQLFPGQVALAHGRMPLETRTAAMASFRSGQTPILVATTVIEVGVDVPEATVMVIEHAERFGLAQLHQLRGRVGRSHRPSNCILLYSPPISATAQARLEALRGTTDGFKIAEMDLALRGAGEVLGQKQSGDMHLRFATPADAGQWMEHAFAMAKRQLADDPSLHTERGQAICLLLRIFNKHNFALSGLERV